MGKSAQHRDDPKELGKYRILKKLGQSAAGAAYLAEDPLLERKAVLKVLAPSMANEEGVARVYQEAKMTARLNHPNIATLYDVGEDKGLVYLATEALEGRDLASLAKSEEGLPTPVILRIMASIAGALQHAHENHVVHRDVKPANIIVRQTGEPVLYDFGLAAAPSGDPLQQKGVFLGSPYYASPEQIRDDIHPPSADIWSLGASMYHLLAGRPVYEGEKWLEILKQAASPDPVDLSPLEGKAPEYVIGIVARCLKKDPDERYRTAEELRRALEAAIDHLERSESDTIDIAPPRPGQTLLLHVEYREADRPGAYREYEIGPRIGGGTYGDVFRGEEKLSGKTAALKVLKREWLADADAVARFRREAALLSRLSHPNIVRVHNFARYGASFLIAMDLLEGPTLEKIMEERGPMDVAQALSFAVPVLSGLAAVHEAGAVHRDLKPSNIAVIKQTDGKGTSGDRPVIFDFGMARARDMKKLTMSGVAVGTVPYMAPEQAAGVAMTAASDVYAAGVILYEMLSGALPHDSDSTYKLLQSIATEPPVPITDRRSDLGEGVVSALERMLAKGASERPTAAEARDLLATAHP